ncbi:MAG TPA: hypothetical protein VG435_21065 [Acidimicrobiales bacterium]|jgi:hypothetical protein|nr:hypothetical protein [Acidimicrobiales bacterium]
MTEMPKPIDTALDLLVYVPVGLAMTAAEELPKLAAKGRTRVQNQLMVARVVGQFAVTKGRQEIERRFTPAPAPPDAEPVVASEPEPPADFDEMTANGSEHHGAASNGSGVSGSANGAAGNRSGGRGSGRHLTALPGADVTEGSDEVTVSTVGDLPAPEPVTAPSAGELAIPGYDSLSASQVLQRLPGLSQDELAAVAAYEQAHRGRRTILNRIDQLQGQ